MKINEFDFRGLPQEANDFKDEVTTAFNYGKFQFQVVTSVPTWKGRKGECVFVMAASGVFFVCTTDNATTWRAVATFSL